VMLLDTSIVSAFLRPDARTKTPKLVQVVTGWLSTEGLAISFVTQFELRRGIEQLAQRGEGRRKLVAFEKFIERAHVLGLDAASGEGWNVAAQLWADGNSLKPAQVFSDADILIASTAAFHGHELATADAGLATGLRRITFPVEVRLIAME
jgi:predicted nucleic acid-binding protein